MRVSVDNQRCTGYARCWAASPDLFTLDDDGYSNIGTGHEVPAGQENRARVAVESCPEHALRIEE
jgi:ferredoxin